MSLNNPINLIDIISALVKKYDEIDKLTGANFNILRIINREYYENFHSAIIADLLNEKGSHNQGATFLNLFVAQFKEQLLQHDIISFTNSTSATELVVTKGRMDIFIADAQSIIIIENKINAGNQVEQIKRYYDDFENDTRNKVIFFLNKFKVDISGDYNDSETFGNIAKEIKAIKEKTISISYNEDIKQWLEKCIKEVWHIPNLRESLNQYLNTVLEITNQSKYKNMEKEFIEAVIKDEERIKSALFISDNIDKIKQAIVEKFMKILKKEIENKFNTVNCYFEMEGKSLLGTSNTGLVISINNIKSFYIWFYFEQDFQNFVFGIHPEKINEKNITPTQTERFLFNEKLKSLDLINFADDKKWSAWYFFTRNYEYFSLEKIISSDSRRETINKHVDLIEKLVNSLKDITL